MEIKVDKTEDRECAVTRPWDFEAGHIYEPGNPELPKIVVLAIDGDDLCIIQICPDGIICQPEIHNTINLNDEDHNGYKLVGTFDLTIHN